MMATPWLNIVYAHNPCELQARMKIRSGNFFSFLRFLFEYILNCQN